MVSSISINGRKVALSRDLDVSDTNYIILRTKGPPLNKKQKGQLRELGVRVEEFVGDEKHQIYLCGFSPDSLNKVQSLEFVEYAGEYVPEFALTKKTEQDSKGQTSTVAIMLHHDVEEISEELTQKIAEAAGVKPSAIVVEDGGLKIKVATDRLDNLAAVDEVRVVHTANEATLFDNKARQILRLDDAVVSQDTPGRKDTVYRGEGQIVCVADTGLDRGSDINVHEAFAGRVKGLYAWGRVAQNLTDDLDGHGTHVCGSVLGKGQHKSHGLVEGTAPGAELLVQSLFSKFSLMNAPRLEGVPQTNLAPLFDQAYAAGARVHTNSWGSALPLTKIQRPYDGRSESIDRFVWEHQDMAILFAAGNDGQDADLDGVMDGAINERSLGAEAAAKNCITVGATENDRPDLVSGDANRPYTYGGFWNNRFSANPLRDDHMADNPQGLAAFSSRGPTAENRLKPDIVAPGTAILSARSQSKKYLGGVQAHGVTEDEKYMYLAGTSMATPLVAGCCAILRQALLSNGYRDEENGVKNPTGALIKALLINGAVPVGGQYMPDGVNEGYNPHSGFGRVDLAASLPKINDPYSGYGVAVADEDAEVPFQVQVPIPSSQERGQVSWILKVTLAYSDLPGGRLQNDLNLVVAIGENEQHGNQVNKLYPLGSTDGFDRHNNVEQVVWQHVPQGTAQIIVKPFRFMAETVPFAYAWKLDRSP